MKLEQVYEKEQKKVLLLSKEDLEKLLSRKKQVKQKKVKKAKKKANKDLKKVLKVSKYNAKGHQELKSPDEVRRMVNYRNWGVN